MVLTPRLRSHIIDPLAMDIDAPSEFHPSGLPRKRQRSATYGAPPDAPPHDLPELPKLSGEIMLEVFTHRSLRLACHAQYRDNERLSVLGHHILEMTTTHLLFLREPKLKRSDIETQRQALLSVEIVDTWAKFYRLRDELRYDSSFQPALQEPEQGRLLFLAYLGAVFNEHGLTNVSKWISALLRLSANMFKDNRMIFLGPADFEEQSGKRFKSEEGSTGLSTHPLQSVIASIPTSYPTIYATSYNTGKPYNPYASQPAPPAHAPPPIPPPPPLPSGGPNPLAPAQPHLAFLPLFNQTATQRGLSVEYPATFSGPPHAGKWNVTCAVNGIEKGRGSGPSKQLAKEQAARAAYHAMGWAPRG